MENLKSLAVLGVAALFIALAFQSCKKGEEDPGLSLSSRTSRLAGEWKMVSMDVTANSTATMDDPNTVNLGNIVKEVITSSYTYDGTTLVQNLDIAETYDDNTTASETSISTISGGTDTYSGSYTSGGTTTTNSGTNQATYSDVINIVIEKDGTFTWDEVLESSEVDTSSSSGYARTTTSTETNTESHSGTWAWLGKDKQNEIANKQRVAFWFSNKSEISSIIDDAVYVDTDATDGIDATAFGSKSTSVVNDTYVNSNTEPDVIWNIIMLKGKEMKVEMMESEDHTSVTTNTTVVSLGTSTVTINSTIVSTSTGKMEFTQE